MSDIMNDCSKVITYTVEQLKDENGHVDFEEGDEVVTVFNNGVLILSMEEGRELHTKFVLGKPFIMDLTIDGIE